jgi:hypothetical protein
LPKKESSVGLAAFGAQQNLAGRSAWGKPCTNFVFGLTLLEGGAVTGCARQTQIQQKEI